MPPMNSIVVHTLILPEERRDPEVLRQAKNLLKKSIVPVNHYLKIDFLIEMKYLG